LKDHIPPIIFVSLSVFLPDGCLVPAKIEVAHQKPRKLALDGAQVQIRCYKQNGLIEVSEQFFN